MHNETRRSFLKRIGAFSAALHVGRESMRAVNAEQTPLDFLVVGDSVVWGQGLAEQEKFYSLTAEWLRNEAFAQPRSSI